MGSNPTLTANFLIAKSADEKIATAYLPISVGYKEFGYAHNFQRPPPNEWEIQHALAKTLYNEGYVLMTKQGHPSLVLVFWWGCMAPEDEDVARNTVHSTKPQAIQFGDQWGAGAPQRKQPPGYALTSAGNALPEFSFGSQNLDDAQMLSMVAGNTVNDHQKYPDPRLDDVVQMTTAARYFILVSALDFQAWLHHKPVLLWRAHVRAGNQGTSFCHGYRHADGTGYCGGPGSEALSGRGRQEVG